MLITGIVHPSIVKLGIVRQSLALALALNLSHNFLRASIGEILDFEAVAWQAKVDEERREGFRRTNNLARGNATQAIIVVVGRLYHVTLGKNSAVGATVVCSGAIVKTLTADNVKRVGFDNGIALSATTTSLILTITGAISELFIEDVTDCTNQNPASYPLVQWYKFYQKNPRILTSLEIPDTGALTDISLRLKIRFEELNVLTTNNFFTKGSGFFNQIGVLNTGRLSSLDGVYIEGTTVLAQDTDYEIVATINAAGQAKIYLDNVLEVDYASSFASSSIKGLGNNLNGNRWLDIARYFEIYDTALTAVQVDNLFNGGSEPTNLIRSYDTDGGESANVTDTVGGYDGAMSFDNLHTQYLDKLNANTANATGEITELIGADIPAATLADTLVEPTAINLFLNSFVPVTQVITLPLGWHCTHSVGTGSIAVTVGTAVIAGLTVDNHGVSRFEVTTAGTINATITGVVNKAQVEAGILTTSPIETFAASATRFVDKSWADNMTATGTIAVTAEFRLTNDGSHYANGDLLFTTKDSRGVGNEAYCFLDDTYNAGVTVSGAVGFQVNKVDWLKGLSMYSLFSAVQETPTQARLIIWVNGLEKLNILLAGVLNHSNQNKITWLSNSAFTIVTPANIKNEQVFDRKLKEAEKELYSIQGYATDSNGVVLNDSFGGNLLQV